MNDQAVQAYPEHSCYERNRQVSVCTPDYVAHECGTCGRITGFRWRKKWRRIVSLFTAETMLRSEVKFVFRNWWYRIVALLALALVMCGCAIRKPITYRVHWEIPHAAFGFYQCTDFPSAFALEDSLRNSQPGFEYSIEECGKPGLGKRVAMTLYCDQKTPDGKHCAVWARHPTACVHDVYGDCTEATK